MTVQRSGVWIVDTEAFEDNAVDAASSEAKPEGTFGPDDAAA